MKPPETKGRWTFSDLALVALAGLAGSIVVVGVGLGGEVTALLVGQFAFTALAMLLLSWLRRRDFRRLDFVVEPRDGLMLLLGAGLQLLLALLFLPVANLVGLDSEPQSLAAEIASARGAVQRVAILLLVGLIGPILEELMFRGILVDALIARFRAKGVVFGSASVFAAFHLIGISTVQPLESGVVLVPQLFIFGVVLAYLRIMRERLGPAIFAHAGFNLLSLSILLFYPELI